MVAGERLEINAFIDEFHFTLPQAVNTVLRGIAVDDSNIIAFHIVKITGDKRRDGRFADTAFLCRECDEYFITHNFTF